MASDPDLVASLRRTAGLRRLASIALCAPVMDIPNSFNISPIGYVHSTLKRRWLQVQNLEAIDGTPIIDIKPVLERSCDS
jgi:hypothetical protein